ncbi:MAG: DUF5615 family PIN-like protein [Ardenticatenales bacterium]
MKLDENLGREVADLLVAAGHDVATVYAQRMTSVPDRTLIAACGAEGRCLVTMDLGFANPLTYDARQHAGIVVLRPAAKVTASDLRHLVMVLIEALRERTVTGRRWIVQRDRIREYQPPDR